MKIALFAPSLRGGGAERVIANLAQGFREHGFRVDLILAEATGPHLSEIPASVRVIDLGVKRVRYALWGLARYLRRERPTFLVSTLRHANVIAIWAKRLSGASVRLVIREDNVLVPTRRRKTGWRARLTILAMRLSYKQADVVVAVSQGVAEDLIGACRLPASKVKVIYNPVVTRELFSKAEEDPNDPWFEPTEPPVVLGVGRLVEQKDFSTLLRAFARVRAKHPCRLIILGEGPERRKLTRLATALGIESDVKMPGYVANPYAYMKRAKVFVLSSQWEGFGNVLVEAMALGTPVIATDCRSGPSEILEGGKWGHLVPVGDTVGLADAIEAVLCGKRTDATNRAHAFTVESVINGYIAVFGVADSC